MTPETLEISPLGNSRRPPVDAATGDVVASAAAGSTATAQSPSTSRRRGLRPAQANNLPFLDASPVGIIAAWLARALPLSDSDDDDAPANCGSAAGPDGEGRGTVTSASSRRVPPRRHGAGGTDDDKELSSFDTRSGGSGFQRLGNSSPTEGGEGRDTRCVDPHSAVVPIRSADNGAVVVAEGANANRKPPSATTHREMLLTLAKGYGPAAATQVLLMMNQYITLMFVGTHLGADALAHFSVGITVYNVGGFSLAIGMSSTLDTLCSQAFGRDPRSAETAEHFVLGSAICVLMCVPVMLFYYHSHAALALVFEPSLAKGASVFLRASPLLLFVSVVLSCWNRLLYAQGRSTVPMLGMIIAVVLCPLLNWKLTPLGVEGSVAALTLTAIVQVTVIVVQVLRDPTIVFMQAFRPRFRWEVYTWARARSFLELGFASIVAVCSEWWVFEALNIVGARLSTVDLDSMAIFFSVSSLCFSVSYGWSASGGALVGNELGAGHPRTARAYAWLTILCCGLGAVVVAVVAALSSRRLFALYTTDEDVLSRLHQVLWLLIVFHIGDATQYVVQSVYRGASLQHQAARVTLATLWLVGLPCATWFALYPPFEWALPGLLGGFILGFVAEIPPLLIGLKNFDWPALSEAAQRAAAEEEAEEQADTPTSVQDADSQQPTPSENDPLH